MNRSDRTPRGFNFRRFFGRGLALILPTLLTIWILGVAYGFLQDKIASPINHGIREVWLYSTQWPVVTHEDAKAAYEVDYLEGSIINLTMTNIRTVMGSMDLDELLSNRDIINAKLLEVVDAATETWGVKVTRIEIKDIAPPLDLVEAMARQMKAEREKRANILDAEGERQADILRAEGRKQSAILEAEGRKEAAFRDAEAREREAEAEGKATAMVSEAIAKGNVQALNYFVAQKYVDALGQFADSPNQKTFFLPVEATGVIGAIGGITEIAREAFKRPDGDAGAAPAGGPWDRT